MNALESAIVVASAHYQRAGKARIRKQETGQTHGGAYRAKSPIDFVGVIQGGQALAIEAKMCALAYFPLSDSHISESQVEALREQHLLGAVAWLVIEMTAYGEVYRVPFAELDRFVKAPWHKHLSIAWLRAFADVVPVSNSDTPVRAAYVLDAKPHPERETAYLAVVADKAKHAGRTVELWPAEVVFRKRRTDDVKTGSLTKEERNARLAGAISDFYDRALRKGSRAIQKAGGAQSSRKWRGGGRQ